jgi:hypothetical protein
VLANGAPLGDAAVVSALDGFASALVHASGDAPR